MAIHARYPLWWLSISQGALPNPTIIGGLLISREYEASQDSDQLRTRYVRSICTGW